MKLCDARGAWEGSARLVMGGLDAKLLHLEGLARSLAEGPDGLLASLRPFIRALAELDAARGAKDSAAVARAKTTRDRLFAPHRINEALVRQLQATADRFRSSVSCGEGFDLSLMSSPPSLDEIDLHFNGHFPYLDYIQKFPTCILQGADDDTRRTLFTGQSPTTQQEVVATDRSATDDEIDRILSLVQPLREEIEAVAAFGARAAEGQTSPLRPSSPPPQQAGPLPTEPPCEAVPRGRPPLWLRYLSSGSQAALESSTNVDTTPLEEELCAVIESLQSRVRVLSVEAENHDALVTAHRRRLQDAQDEFELRDVESSAADAAAQRRIALLEAECAELRRQCKKASCVEQSAQTDIFLCDDVTAATARSTTLDTAAPSSDASAVAAVPAAVRNQSGSICDQYPSHVDVEVPVSQASSPGPSGGTNSCTDTPAVSLQRNDAGSANTTAATCDASGGGATPARRVGSRIGGRTRTQRSMPQSPQTLHSCPKPAERPALKEVWRAASRSPSPPRVTLRAIPTSATPAPRVSARRRLEADPTPRVNTPRPLR